MGEEIEDWDISLRSFDRMRGFVIRWRKMVRTAPAVVSEPAILSRISGGEC